MVLAISDQWTILITWFNSGRIEPNWKAISLVFDNDAHIIVTLTTLYRINLYPNFCLFGYAFRPH